jgi:hypothetical protein
VKESLVQKLDTKTVNKEKEDNVCAICITLYRKGQKVFFLPCKHHFHTDCIRPWFEKNSHCPVCRSDLKEAMGISGDQDP